jgi:hypothetical protein
MGVGYCVSPLHRMVHIDASAITSRPPIKGSNSPIDRVAELTGTNVGVGTPRLYSPTIEEILVWRQGLATKYRDQLEEGLTWDESSTLEVSEDVATSGDVMFHYVAAVLDQHGKSELSKLSTLGNRLRINSVPSLPRQIAAASAVVFPTYCWVGNCGSHSRVNS